MYPYKFIIIYYKFLSKRVIKLKRTVDINPEEKSETYVLVSEIMSTHVSLLLA